MKGLYKVILFLGLFQIVVIMISALNVFPYTLYDDIDSQQVSNLNTAEDWFGYFFVPQGSILGSSYTQVSWTIAAIMGLFLVAGSIIAWKTQSFAPVVIALLGLSFFPMITKSLGFFNRLFTDWDISAITYLGLLLAVGIIMLIMFTIMETPTHGRS